MLFNLLLCLIIVVIYFLTHFGERSKESKDKLFLIISFVLLFLLVAFRGSMIGNDTSSYIELYKKCDVYKWDILSNDGYFERGYLVFNIVLSYLHLSPRMFLVIVALICSGSVYLFIKNNSKNYLMSILMYINLMFFFQSMNIMRQFLALSIILLGFQFVKEKKLWKYALTVLFASLFHSTAFIAILIYPFYHIKYTRKRVLIILSCSILGLLSLSYIYPLLSSLLGKETYYLSVIGETKLANIVLTAIFVVMYIFSLFVLGHDRKQKYSFYLYSILLAAATNCIAINMSVLGRAAQYFEIISIVALPNIIEANIYKSKLVFKVATIGFLMAYSSTVILLRPEWNSAYHYEPCALQEEGFICE